MANLIDRITQIFKRQAVTPDTTTRLQLPLDAVDLSKQFRADRDRRTLVEACNRMFDEDPRCEGAINTLARDIAKGGFQVTSKNAKAVTVAENLIGDKRLKLKSTLDDWLRETFIDGDSLLEVGVSEDLEIVEVTRKPTLDMRRNTNAADKFSDPTRAFWYSDDYAASFGSEAPRDAIWFAEWQIIHARWAHRSKRRYGRPLFASASGPWKRIVEGEIDIAIRRKTRAGQKFLHVVEGADEAGLEAYKKRNQAVLNNPFEAVSDFFTNKPGSVQVIQGDARLAEIEDVVHHIETWWTASPVPMVLVGYGKDLNRDVLEQKLDQYNRSLEALTQWTEDEFVKPLLEREWLLHGIYPQGLTYEIEWKAKANTTPADLRNISDAIVRLKALSVPDKLIWAIVARYLPWLDLTTILEQDQPLTVDDTQAARLSASLGAA